jgi:pyruvate kinase
MRRTKIVWTIGPATRSPQRLEELMRAGMDIARLNFSHGTPQEHGRTIRDVRRISRRLGRPVAILQDLAGPKIRIGPIEGAPIPLKAGKAFRLTTRKVRGNTEEVAITYMDLPREVMPNDRIFLGDGDIELSVRDTTSTDIRCLVVTGGPLGPHKGINLPDRSVGLSAMTSKDRRDLAFGIASGVDYVRTAVDVQKARRLVRRSGHDIPLIAKIEKKEALNRIDEIIAAVDGIMIARGDLGVEIPIEQVPRVQKMLIEKANRAGIPVITATQMLRSMVENPRPTRAEATDVANAILDGSGGVMLSEETAIGAYPLDAVRIMSRIAEETETVFPYHEWMNRFGRRRGMSRQEAVAHAACQLAEEVGAEAIITFTQSGSTTRLVAKYRPAQSILAITPDPETLRRLAMVWGAIPVRMPAYKRLEEMEKRAIQYALTNHHVQPGSFLVITAGLPITTPGSTNLIRVAKAG